ncbi:MAG: hypothetical protein SGI97_05070 [candidate division Zixibacteria bacterium]|nr:hypothetical protein [candidate division Zixibacteria bacterium]
MKYIKNKIGVLGLILAGLIAAGCLVSGTFVVVEDFNFTTEEGFYRYPVDITDNADWKEHKDKIDQIDAVGAEFNITNNQGGPVTFKVWVDDFGANHASVGAVEANATQILELTVPAGKSKVTYVQSLNAIMNIGELKRLAKFGQFDYYGTSTGNNPTAFVVDSGKVIVTFSASGL